MKQQKTDNKKNTVTGIITLILIVLVIKIIWPDHKDDEPAPDLTTPEGIFESLNIKCSDLKIIPSGSNLQISFTSEQTAWDATDFVSRTVTDYIDFCKLAYGLDGVDHVDFYVFTDFTDPKGNTFTEKAVAIGMPKDRFETYNWSGMLFKPGLYEQLEKDCDLLDLHAGLASDVDKSEVQYKSTRK